MDRSRLEFLQDIVQEARDVQSFVAGCGWEQFKDDIMRRKAVQCSLSNIAEAIKNLDEPTRASLAATGLPLREIVGMRNLTSQEYWPARAQLLWKTATEDMEPLLAAVARCCP